MSWWRFIRRAHRDAESAKDIQFYLDAETDDNIARGMSAEEAQAAARRKFGNDTAVREEIYRMNTVSFLEVIWRDLLYSLRTMRKNPVFVGTAVLTLALAIGGNTAMFTIVRAVLLKPLQYRDSDQLVRMSGGATPTRFAEMRSGARSFAELGAFTRQENLTLSGISEPEIVRGVHVSASFLRLLGVDPLLGRSFRPEEDSPGGMPVVMISAELWQRRFGRDSHIIGKAATFNVVSYTIIGVLPPRFQFPSGLDVWMTDPSGLQTIAPNSRALSPVLTIFGRLNTGVRLDQANAEMKVIRRQYAMAHPSALDAKPKTPTEVILMKDDLVSNVRSMLWILFGAVGFVLMIACSNLANLLLTRATSREREFALRSALGAARSRLIGQLLSESILLSIFGGTVGILLAHLCMRIIPGIAGLDLPRQTEVHMDGVVFGFAAALSIATGLVFGLAPSVRASKPDLTHVLRASGEGASRRASPRMLTILNVRSLLSVGQVALSIVLLIGAALLIESVSHLRNVPVGFNPSNLLTLNVSLPPLRYDIDEKISFFFEEISRRVGLLPGVRSAAAAMSLPMMDYAGIPVQDAAKPKLPLNQRLIAKFFPITPGYFRTLDIPLKQGREFTAHDNRAAKRVAIIDENLARRLWPAYPAGVNPIGQHLWVGGVNPKPAEIVGVVADVRQNLDDREDWQESVYLAFAQSPAPSAMIAIRTAGNSVLSIRAVRDQIRMLDRNQPVGTAQTMEDLIEAQVGQRRLLEGVLGSFAFVALILALIGIYGVIAYSFAQRIQEIGIRRALGAQQSDILRLVIGEGLVLSLAGIVVGIGGALALTRLMRSLLFQVSATDLTTFIGVALLFLLVAIGASYIPARRALRIDPMAALRV